MNYIAYKNIDGTITSGFKVKLYDIVTLNTGYWKDKLAIVLYINEDKKQIKVRIIECGMVILILLLKHLKSIILLILDLN